MRSKPKARRLANEDPTIPYMTLQEEPQEDEEGEPSHSVTADVQDQDFKDEPPVYIPEDIPIPDDFQLQESGVFNGLGVWTVSAISKGEKFGPFGGTMKETVESPTSAWELVDNNGKVKGWIDASEPGTGNWMKYVRSTPEPRQQNVMALQADDQVFYKSIRDISPGEEMLLYERDAVYHERDMDPVSSPLLQGDRQFDCIRCGDTFRSKVALGRHQTYVCNNKHAIFNTIHRNFQVVRGRMDEFTERDNLIQTSHSQERSLQQQISGEMLTGKEIALDISNSRRLREELEETGSERDKDSSETEMERQEAASWPKPGRANFDTLEGSDNDQSEEMLQTSAADDHSALGSPDEQPYTPLLDTISNSSEGLKTFHCENCDKQFTDPSNLQRHIRSQHVGARSHACPECGKTFATSSGLKQHQHIHSSVKPFQCEVCLKAYTQFSNLCRHKRMHADCRQQIKCKDCGQAFSTMTSLSKHKRFCEGMIRSNGSARIPFSGLPSNPDKSPGASMVSPMHGQSPSALASVYANFYGPRPPFPFYPPLGGTGFPVFPTGHHLASMASHMQTDSRLGGPGVHKVTPLSPGSNSLVGQTGEMKREKNASEGSEADSSEVSSASDLDTSTGSDGDSEFGLGHRRHEKPMLRAHLNGTVPVINTNTRLSKSPLSAPPAAHSHRTPNHKESIREREEKNSEDDAPFDLSKSSPSTSASGDQPLDLSTKFKDVATIPQTTPRKTHIFGAEEKRRTPTSSSASPETPPPPPPPPQHLPEVASPSVEQERKLHYAFSMPGTVVGMDPMYRVDKEKLQSYQDAAARMMGFGPRLPMHSSAVNFGALSGGLGMLSGRPDASKLLPPMLGKVPEQFHYNSSVNKLKERYACKFCGKIFPRSANLTRHLRTHTGEQPYKCKYCERSFSISSNLQRHVRNIHNKEKPFKCPLCDRCFGQQTNLDRHLKKHESDDPNMIDSPLPQEHELEEKDESYFDEIRNFIGKATGEGGNPSTEEGVSMQPEFPRATIDSNFPITAQLEKQSKMAGEKRSAPMDDDEEEEGTDLSPKKSRLENNNEEEEDEEEVKGLGNGYHRDEEEDEDVDPEEDIEEEEEGSLNDLSDLSKHNNVNAAPLACTS